MCYNQNNKQPINYYLHKQSNSYMCIGRCTHNKDVLVTTEFLNSERYIDVYLQV